MTIAIVCGLEQEAAIIRQACPKALVVVGAGDAALLRDRLDAALNQDAIKIDRVLSAGICGGLNPTLHAGDVVVGVNAVYGEAVVTCDLAWADRLYGLNAAWARFTWSATAVIRLSDKAALRKATGADVVDEETGIAGSIRRGGGGCASSAIPPRSNPAGRAREATGITATTWARSCVRSRAIFGSCRILAELAGMSATAMGNLKAAISRVSARSQCAYLNGETAMNRSYITHAT